MNKAVTRSFLFTISAAVFWGISGTFGQFLFQERGINVEWLITMRMLVPGFLLLLFAKYVGKAAIFSVWTNKKDTIQLLLFSITGMLSVQYTYFAAIKHSNAATATVIQYAGPVIIAAYLAIKHRRIPTMREITAIVLAVSGTFLLVTHGNFHSLAISRTALFFGLASAVALAVYTLQPIPLLVKYNPAVIIGWGMLCGGLAFSFVKAPWEAEGYWDGYTWLYTAFIILLGTLVAFTLYLYAVTVIGAQKASLLASAEPLAATLLAVYWLNTPFYLVDWIGTIFIISTIFLLSKTDKPDH